MTHRSIPMILYEIPRSKRDQRRRSSVGRSIEVLEDRLLLADGIQASPGPQINGSPGVMLNNVEVASYIITNSSGSPGTKWRDHVDWGDNTTIDKTHTKTPTLQPDGSFEFLDSHTYSTAG